MYYTIRKTGYGEYEEKKSRFISEAVCVHSAKEAEEKISLIKKQYYDAKHHCSAWIIGEKKDSKKAQDDGEPQGTAGLPILHVMESMDCTDTLVVVTRYFGGILLGTGGLVRAYTKAATEALQNAELVCMRKGEMLRLNMAYEFFSQVQYFVRSKGLKLEGLQYTDHVACLLVVPEEEIGNVEEKLKSISAGKIQMESIENGYYCFDKGKGAG